MSEPLLRNDSVTNFKYGVPSKLKPRATLIEVVPASFLLHTLNLFLVDTAFLEATNQLEEL